MNFYGDCFVCKGSFVAIPIRCYYCNINICEMCVSAFQKEKCCACFLKKSSNSRISTICFTRLRGICAYVYKNENGIVIVKLGSYNDHYDPLFDLKSISFYIDSFDGKTVYNSKLIRINFGKKLFNQINKDIIKLVTHIEDMFNKKV